MAVKRRLKFYSGIRLDIPHLRSFESAVSYDFDSTLRGVLTGINNPYVVKGFDISFPIGLQAVNLQLKVGGSVILHSTASESGTIMQVPQTAPDETLNALNPNVIGSFQNGVINYVALDYRREVDEESVDQTAGWSPSEKLEFQRTVPISTVLQYKVVITTSGFGNLLPLYIVGVNSSGFVTFITNSKPSLFRLGSGGTNPNPFNSFTYGNLTNPQSGNRREFIYPGTETTNPVSVGPGADSSAFSYGDWSIGSLKEWMDAVMTRFKEVTGSSYWYIDSNLPSSPAGAVNLANVWFDSGAGSVMTGSGNVAYNYVLQADLASGWSYGAGVKSGDSYIKGVTSGATAVLNNVISDVNYNYLLVTDVVGSFDYSSPENIQNRRLLKHNPNLFELITISFGGASYGLYQRKPLSTATTVAGTLALVSGDEYSVTSASHGLNNGDIVCIISGSNKKIVQVSNKTVNTFRFKTKSLNGVAVGAITLAKTLAQVDQTAHPYPYNFSSAASFNLDASGASPEEYNAVDVTANAYSSVEFWYPLEYGSQIPAQLAATGPIVFDGEVVTTVLSIASELPSGATSNPYNGPVSWSSDIYVKGIVGNRYYKLDSSAAADPAGTADIYGNGTAYLNNGEVAYIILDRNQPVSNSQLFTCAAAGGPIVGSTPPVDVNGNPLVAGDFVKFANESDQYWLRIDSIAGNTINLINDAGTAPTSLQRPVNNGVLLYSKGSYSTVYVRPHWQVEDNINTYWLAVRRDFSGVSKVYFRSLELEPGESRTINDNQPNNLLIYTGAGTEAATSPEYMDIDSGQWGKSQSLTLAATSAVNGIFKQVSFASAPDLGFQKNDRFKTSGGDVYTIDTVLTNKTVITKEDPTSLTDGATVTYQRLNYSINESDNLTLAIRKEDRELAKINTRLTKPVYDESVFLQVMPITLSPGQTLRSGSFVYVGTITNPTALAWVLYGSSSVNETIEGSTVAMPGGSVFGANTALVHIYTGGTNGGFTHGTTVFQNTTAIGTINNSGNPVFTSPTVAASSLVEIVLPPNRRTQLLDNSSNYVTFPNFATYSKGDGVLSGEDLMVIANDTIREANIDYTETFGGPKAKIRIDRDLPANTRMRFRTLATVGSPVHSSGAGIIDLQSSYNAGNTINTALSTPVTITATGADTALALTGSLTINGSGASPLNGIFGNTDQNFVIGNESNKPSESWSGKQAIKTHANWTGSAWSSKTATQVTTNSSPTVVTNSGVTIDTNTALRVCMTAVGRSDTNTGYASYRVEGMFKREAGNVVAIGSPVSTIIAQDGDGTATSLVFGIMNPDTVVAILIGHGSNQYNWAVTLEWQAVKNSS